MADGWWKFPRSYMHLFLSMPGPQVKVALHVLDGASQPDHEWHDGPHTIPVKQGSLVTSQNLLAMECDTTRQVVRDALGRMERSGLIKTGYISADSGQAIAARTRTTGTKRYTLITVIDTSLYVSVKHSKEPSKTPDLFLPDFPTVPTLPGMPSPSPAANQTLTTYSNWPEEWQGVHQAILDAPKLQPFSMWLNDLEWWQGVAKSLQVTATGLPPILTETATYFRTVGYTPRSKRALRMKLRNCLPVAQSRLEAAQQHKGNGKDPYASLKEVWTCKVCGEIHETPKGAVRRCQQRQEARA